MIRSSVLRWIGLIALVIIAVAYFANWQKTFSPSHETKFQQEVSNLEGIPGTSAATKNGNTKVAASITPDKAKMLLSETKTLTNAKDRSRASFNIIKNLCQAGYSKEAFELIETNPGMVRQWELNAYFQYSTLGLSSILGQLKTLPFAGELKEGLIAKMDGMTVNELSSLLTTPEFTSFIKIDQINSPDLLKTSLGEHLMARSVKAEDDDQKWEVINFAIQQKSNALVKDSVMAIIIAKAPVKSPWALWDLVSNNIRSTVREGYAGALRSQTIENMVQSNATQAMEFITKDATDQGAWDLSRGLEEWLTIDSEASTQWYEANKKSFTDGQKDGAALAFYNLAVQVKELDGAEKWANQIADPAKRKLALDKLVQK